jgi:hypothetical protein
MRGYSEAVADYLSSAQDILLIVPSPVCDLFVDIYGHRFHFVVLAPIAFGVLQALASYHRADFMPTDTEEGVTTKS